MHPSTRTSTQDDRLDALLAAADPAPPLSLRTEHLAAAVARAPMRRARRRPVLVGAGVVAVGLLGTGSAAAFAGLLPGQEDDVRVVAHTSYAASDGQTCVGDWQVGPEGGASPDDPAVVEAAAYLASIDYDHLDITTEVAKVRQETDSSSVQWNTALIENYARFRVVWAMTKADLEARGLDPDHVALDLPSECRP